MKSRLAASVVLSALVLTSATGCTFITHQASTISYSASDGVNVSDDSGPVAIRNAMVIADESGRLGNLVAAFVNSTDEDLVVNIEVHGLERYRLLVPAGETVSLGSDAEPLLMDSAEGDGDPLFALGSTVEIYFQSGDGTGAAEQVPVLDGTLSYYSDLAPQPVEDENAVDDATPSPSGTPEPTETAAH